MSEPLSNESFQIQRHSGIPVVVPSAELETMSDAVIEQAAQMVLAQLRADPPSILIIDLGRVGFFGTVLISFLLKCHLLLKKQNPDSELVLAGCSERVREILRQTNLDTLWALYDSRTEAVDMLGGSD